MKTGTADGFLTRYWSITSALTYCFNAYSLFIFSAKCIF
jgi:hypothetical protein